MKYGHALTLISTLMLGFLSPCLAYNLDNTLGDWSCESHSDNTHPLKMNVDPVVKYRGSPCAHLQSMSPDASKSYYLQPWQDFKAEDSRGKRVAFSAFLKTEKLHGKANLFMRVKAGHEVVAFANMQENAITTSSDWQKYAVVLDVPANATSIRIGMRLEGSGDLWVSEPNYAVVGKDVKTNAVAWDAKKFKEYSDSLRNQPKNFDFATVASEAGPKQIVNWGLNDGQEEYDLFVDRDLKLNGLPSACIEARVAEPKDYAAIYQDINATDYLAKRLKFTAFVKTSSVRDWAALWVRIKDSLAVVAFDNMEDRPIKGTNDWKEYSISLNVPADSQEIRIGLMQAGPGKTWFSNCSLSAVGPIDKTGNKMHGPVLPISAGDKLKPKPYLELRNR